MKNYLIIFLILIKNYWVLGQCGTFSNIPDDLSLIPSHKLKPIFPAHFYLYDIQGQLISENSIENQYHTLDINLSDGIYFVKVYQNGKSYLQKMVIEK